MASKDNKRPVTERRVFNLTECEVRSEGDGPVVFSGYAAVFNELSVNLGGFRERIRPGAFRTAVEEGDDVRFLINHDPNLILGRTPATLKLTEDERGLHVECELGNQTYAQDLAESMRRGDISAMSFGFTTRADAWPEKDAESGLPIRELVDVGLFDVSAVAYPAYPDTTAAIRAAVEADEELQERAAKAAEELPEPEAREDEPEDKPEDENPEDDEKPEDSEEEKPEDEEEADEDRAAAAELADEGSIEAKTREAWELFEELRAEAGVRIEEGHPQCDGIAVVWNWNDELQSCHDDRAEAEAQVEAMTSGAAGAARSDETDERAGKVLSSDNEEKLTQAMTLLHGVMSAAGVMVPGFDDMGGSNSTEANSTLPDIAAFRADLEERGWTYDDDWAVYILTSMISLASSYLLCEGGQGDDDNDDDTAEDSVMQAIISQLTALLDSEVAEGAAGRDAETGEERDDESVSMFDRERRRLRLMELETSL